MSAFPVRLERDAAARPDPVRDPFSPPAWWSCAATCRSRWRVCCDHGPGDRGIAGRGAACAAGLVGARQPGAIRLALACHAPLPACRGRARHQRQPRVRRWRRITLVGVLASGLAWGLPTAYWLQHVPLPHQMFLIIALLTMGTGAIYAYCIDLPVLYSFLLPYFLPMLLMLTALDQTLLTVMGVAGLLPGRVADLRPSHASHAARFAEPALREPGPAAAAADEKMAAERSDLAKSRFLAAASDLRQPVHALSLFVGVLKGMRCPRRAASWWTASRARCRRWAACSMACSTSRGWTRAWCVRRCSRWRSPTCSIACSTSSRRRRRQNRCACACAARGHGLVGPGAAGPHPAQPDPQRHPSHERGGVLVGCRRDGDALRVEVWDSGGHSLHEQERLLGIPSAGQPRTRPRQGLGLGLAIVQRTARLLGHPLACAPGRAAAPCSA